MNTTEILSHTDHRPWPLPRGPWMLKQVWNELLFAHWPVDPSTVASRVPVGLALDTYGGNAWISLVPFRMSGVRPHGTPVLPGISRFPEINVRTYVVAGNKPGVWFFSLDAGNPLAVAVARSALHLPYFNAHFSVMHTGDQVTYASHRTTRHTSPADFVGEYGPIGTPYLAQRRTLEHWLTERYCLYTTDSLGHIIRGEIHHRQWPLQPARAAISVRSIVDAAGITLPNEAPLLQYAASLEVLAWPFQRAGSTGR